MIYVSTFDKPCERKWRAQYFCHLTRVPFVNGKTDYSLLISKLNQDMVALDKQAQKLVCEMTNQSIDLLPRKSHPTELIPGDFLFTLHVGTTAMYWKETFKLTLEELRALRSKEKMK